jgi:hypothetical protein
MNLSPEQTASRSEEFSQPIPKKWVYRNLSLSKSHDCHFLFAVFRPVNLLPAKGFVEFRFVRRKKMNSSKSKLPSFLHCTSTERRAESAPPVARKNID